MSVCRHELGGDSTPSTLPRQFQPCLEVLGGLKVETQLLYSLHADQRMVGSGTCTSSRVEGQNPWLESVGAKIPGS